MTVSAPRNCGWFVEVVEAGGGDDEKGGVLPSRIF
jgi:hypothetical protein